MRASPPSPSRTKIVGDAVPFRAVLVLLCRGGRPCPPFPRHSEPVRPPAWESVSPCLPLRGRWQREALAEGAMPRVFLSPSRLRRQPPPRGGLTARHRRADGTSGRRPLQNHKRHVQRGGQSRSSPTKMTTLSGGHFLRFYAPVSEPARPRWGCWRPETHRCRCAWWWRRPC